MIDKCRQRKNPFEETGKEGRGKLWYYETNYAADALLVAPQRSSGACNFLAIQRRDGTWGTPGGFHDPGESSRVAALRELGEEAVRNVDLVAPRFESEATCIYQGYASDPRNTDDAWIETSLYLLSLPERTAEQLVIEAEDDAQDARWIGEDQLDNYTWYASHKTRIQEGLKIFKNRSKEE